MQMFSLHMYSFIESYIENTVIVHKCRVFRIQYLFTWCLSYSANVLFAYLFIESLILKIQILYTNVEFYRSKANKSISSVIIIMLLCMDVIYPQ